MLETLGLIARKRGRGIFIVNDEIDFIDEHGDSFSDFEVFWFTDHNPKMTAIMEILEARRMIEPRIAQLAAKRADMRDIARLQKCLRKKIADPESAVLAFSEFHRLLAKCTKSDVIVDLLDNIVNDVIWDVVERDATDKKACEKSLEGHYLIAQCIKSKDSNGAYKAMFNHLKEIEILIFSLPDERTVKDDA